MNCNTRLKVLNISIHSGLENRTIEEFWKEYKLSNQSPINVA